MYSLRLFGGPSLEGEQGLIGGRVVRGRCLALLSLLSAADAQPITRDKLIALLWPDHDTERARHLLSQALYLLRQSMGDDVVLPAGDGVRLNPERIRSDVQEFVDSLARGDRERAAALYRGPFLDGFHLAEAPEFERWLEVERERLARRYGQALEALAEEREARGEFPAAVEWWRCLAVHDPYSAHATLRLMRALDAAGQRTAALQCARVHEVLLREELGVEPDPRVIVLADRLRTEGTHGGAPDADGEARPTSGIDRPSPEDPPAPVSTESAGSAALRGEAARESPTSAKRAPRRWPARWAVLAVSVTVAAAALTVQRGGERERQVPSLAVLPFADLSGDPANTYFADGVHEDLLVNLSRTASLQVISRTSVMPYRNQERNLRQIAGELGVSHVLEGSVRRAGDRVRVTAQLIDARTDAHLWGETYDRELTDVFAIQSDVAQKIALALQMNLSPSDRRRIAAPPTQDFGAYEEYLKGRYFWNRRTAEDLAKAIRHFEQAIARDPSFALAYAGLADSYILLPPYSQVPPQEAYPKARAAALKALELDESLASAHTSLAYVRFWYDWDWAGAERAFRRALELGPNDATAHQWYAEYLATRRRFEEALHVSQRALRLDPLSLVVRADAAAVHYYARQYETAIEQLQKILDLDPDFGLARWFLGMSYEAQGKHVAAIAELEKTVELIGGSDVTHMYLAHAYARAGRRNDALRILRELQAQQAERRVNPTAFAFIHAGLGEKEEAFRWLERAVEERSILPFALTVHAQLDPLRSDPRYARLLARVGLR